jgi:hypothetical protein
MRTQWGGVREAPPSKVQIDAAWNRIQDLGTRLGGDGRTINFLTAKMLVSEIFRSEGTQPPPREILELFALELQTSIEKRRG